MPTKKKTAKPVAAKKTTKKKVVATKKVAKKTTKKPVVNKAQVAPKTKIESPVVKKPVVAESKQEKKVTEQPKNTVEVTKFFYATVVLMIVFLYAELVAGILLYYNYEIQIHDRTEIMRDWKQISLRKTAKRRVRRRRPAKITNQDAKKQEVTKAVEKDVPALRCPPLAKRKVVFNEKEYLPYNKGGKAVIEGDLCFSLKDGSQKCFGDTEIFINPVTSYSNEWYQRNWAGRERLEDAHPRAYYYNKKIKTDKNGKFKFENLASGSYYIATALCMPETKDTPKCHYRRYATRIDMKNYAKPKLQQVYP